MRLPVSLILMGFYLAIDAGGTKTTCLLADEARILARAGTGTVKLMHVSEEEATRRLQSMFAEAAAKANVSLDRVTRTCMGLAGGSSPAVQDWAYRTVSAKVAGELLLCGDEEIALDAAFAGGPGILVIAGTGSNIIGRTADGSLHSAGGWGPVIGDEGSGYWIGVEAIRAALHNHDQTGLGVAASRLLPEIQTQWLLGSLAELVAYANQRTGAVPPDFASLAPIVAACAEADGNRPGDALAVDILQRAGEELAAQVALVHKKMGAPAKIAVAFTGSVLSQILAVRAAMTARLVVSVPAAHVQEAPVDPLEGALWLARRG
jgi:N-acetylglucosamine kinase-like BadF-type ATPase